MTAPQHGRITSRGRYVGMLEKNDGLVIYFRMEHRVAAGRWVANGPLLELALSDDHVVGEAWYNALGSSAERKARVLQALTETLQEEPIPGIG